MNTSRTFSLIKPDAIAKNYAGEILHAITQGGFRIAALKMVRMSTTNAEQFYAIHKGKPFYDQLVQFMSSGPVIALVLEKENAVDSFRELIGSTNPSEAAEGTIRKQFATSIGENAVHGSDSDANAITEASFFFSEMEMV